MKKNCKWIILLLLVLPLSSPAASETWTATQDLNALRSGHSATLLLSGEILVVGGNEGGGTSVEVFDPTTGQWRTKSPALTPRQSHTATLLPSGKVLLAGGDHKGALGTAELYDPQTDTWATTGSLANPRRNHTATLLPSGDVLVAGGTDPQPLDSVEIYDVSNGNWRSVEPLGSARGSHTATLLQSGKVLVVGGASSSSTLADAEIFDPEFETWQQTSFLTTAREKHTATCLPSGEVLIAGGSNETGTVSNAELYDPFDGSWQPSPGFSSGQPDQTATVLPSGQVLIVGGGNNLNTSNAASVYDPMTGQWRASAPLIGRRAEHTATLLPSGRVLVAGGKNAGSFLRTAEIFDPIHVASGMWTSTGDLGYQRSLHTATLLKNGKVLVAGGRQSSIEILSEAEVYDPDSGLWTPTQNLLWARQGHTATLLPSGKVLVAGGYDGNFSGTFVETELYDPETETWQPTGSLFQSRNFATATLLPSGQVLVIGGYDESGFEELASAELYNPATGQWRLLPSMQNGRSRHSASFLPPTGEILVVGGSDLSSSTQAELFHLITDSWSGTGSLAIGRNRHTATLTASGETLVSGGYNSTTPRPEELYTAATKTWRSTGSLATDRKEHTTTLLKTGQVLAVGGRRGSNHLPSAEVYDPASGTWKSTGSLHEPRFDHTATLLKNGKVLVTGGFSEGAYLSSAELFHLEGPPPDERRPSIQSHPPTMSFGEPFAMTGNFRSDSETSGGGTNGSAANYPLIELRRADGTEIQRLVAAPQDNFWDNPMTLTVSELPPSLTPGDYLLTVSVAGVSSTASPVEMLCSLSLQGPADSEPVQIGETATFTISAQGARRLQWQKDGVDIPGATGPTYTTPPVTAGDSGSTYRAIAENDCTTKISEEASLRIFDELPPTVNLLRPDGGEFWALSVQGAEPKVEQILWQMEDDIRICQVTVRLLYSNNQIDFVELSGGGLPVTFGVGNGPDGTSPCTEDEQVTQTQAAYTVPTSPPSGNFGSEYIVQVDVTDQANRTTSVTSSMPFLILEPNLPVSTLILHHPNRMLELGTPPEEVNLLVASLQNLARHQRVLGYLVDLGDSSDLDELYEAWDADRANPDRANQVLFGCPADLPLGCSEPLEGVHSTIQELKQIYRNVTSVVLVGDDRIIPLARIQDRTVLFPENNYPSPDNGDLTPDGTSVGEALAANKYLTDDPLVTLDPIRPDDLNGSLFLPDLSVGRLVETPSEIRKTIAAFISRDGVLDLSEAEQKVQVAGYDFLTDAARRIFEQWTSALGNSLGHQVDGDLIGRHWNAADLLTHLCGDGHVPYGLLSFNGHASHFLEGIPGTDPIDIQGLSTFELVDELACGNESLDLSGRILSSIGCHGGLPVPGSDPFDADHSLDLPQTFLRLGAAVYIANSGYGWGLEHGVGYSERLVELFNIALTKGGTTILGEAVQEAKLRYFMESPRFDPYDEKTLMQWTFFGLPMYAVDAGIFPDSGSSARFTGDPPKPDELAPTQRFGSVVVNRRASGAGVDNPSEVSLPDFITRLQLGFEFGDGTYRKYNALGEEVQASGCPDPMPGDPAGCYYTLNSLSDNSYGITDHPIQPYFIYESTLSGTSQHGVLWLGGEFEQEAGWQPVIARLMSNGGDGSDHGVAPRLRFNKPNGPRNVPGADPPLCRQSDSEQNSVVVNTAELLKEQLTDADYLHRIFREVDLEILYFNNTSNPGDNCDRKGPQFGAPPLDGRYHDVRATFIDWKVPVDDPAGVWRVVVVYTDGVLDSEGRGQWLPLELSYDPDQEAWTGSLQVNVEGAARITYLLQAVDQRGNVSWLDFSRAELPSSGVDLDLPDAIDVEILQGTSNLSLTVVDYPDPVQIDRQLSYEISAHNSGPDPASLVRVTFEPPIGTTHHSLDEGDWSCNSSQPLDCTFDYLASGQSTSPLIVTVLAPSEIGTLDGMFFVEAQQLGSTDNAEISTQVIKYSDLRIALDDGQNLAVPGEEIQYVVELCNIGPDPVSAVILDLNPSTHILDPVFSPDTGEFSPGTGEWSGISLAAAGCIEGALTGQIDSLATGDLVSHISVTTTPQVLDPGPTSNSTMDTTELADIQPPGIDRIHSVSATGDDELSQGESSLATITQLYLTFSEPVLQADLVSSYRLLRSGEDGIFQSLLCIGGILGDDELIPVDAADFESATLTATLRLNGGLPLPRGNYRLGVCSAIEDEASNAITEVALGFKIEVDHLLRHSNFDPEDLGVWQAESPAGWTFTRSPNDVDDAPTSGSALLSGFKGSEPAALWQCLSADRSGDLHFGGRVRIDGISVDESTPAIVTQIETFATESCTGAPTSVDAGAPFTTNTLGQWDAFEQKSAGTPAGTQSILFSLMIQADDSESFEVYFDDLYLHRGLLFADGFESGDTSRWDS